MRGFCQSVRKARRSPAEVREISIEKSSELSGGEILGVVPIYKSSEFSSSIWRDEILKYKC